MKGKATYAEQLAAIPIEPSDDPVELIAEMAAWEKASDEAWNRIDQCENNC